MSSDSQLYLGSALAIHEPECVRWYALQTRARHEKVVGLRLNGRGMITFLPVVKEVHRWWDRRRVVELPMFSSYLFVRLAMTSEERIRVCRVDGILGFVGFRGQGTPIPDEQIEAVQRLTLQDVGCTTHPFLKVGQRVRIRGGSLNGIEGVLTSQNGHRNLVVSVNAIQRSLAINLKGYEIEPV